MGNLSPKEKFFIIVIGVILTPFILINDFIIKPIVRWLQLQDEIDKQD